MDRRKSWRCGRCRSRKRARTRAGTDAPCPTPFSWGETMTSAADILDQLNARADPGNLEGMGRFGMAVEKRLGVAVPDMRHIAKATGKDHELAMKLWDTGIAEATIV